MACPRCGFSEPGPVECPRCGVVFAKLDRPARSAPEAPVEFPAPPSDRRRFSWTDAALLAALVAAGAVIVLRRTETPTAPREPVAVARREPPAGVRPAPRPLEPEIPSDTPSLESPEVEFPEPAPRRERPPATAGPAAPILPLAPQDWEVFASLSILIADQNLIESAHVQQAEALHARYPAVPDTGRVLEEVLERAARQADERGRPADARRHRERATEVFPGKSAVWLRLISAHEQSGAWPEAERAARRGLSALPDESWLHLALARALRQQGRDEEAADVLRRRLASRGDDEPARRELARLESQLDSVASLARRRSSHFSIRFEGEPDAALGDALLEVLEEKYAMLARILESEPDREIPVILYPRQTFRSVSTAPEWAGGYYSRSDARIRIGTRDLTPGFVPLDLERTLTHELAHAFIHARTRGAVPDDINEGLAQYLSGKRLGYRLDPRRAEVVDGKMRVDDFYDSALSFVEYLIDRHRQPTLNELLRHAGETGSVEQAFRRVLHQSYEETREEWLKSLR